MARPRGAKLTQDRLSDGSIVFSAEVTVAVGDRRHVTLGYSREGMDHTAALKQLEKVQATVALGQWLTRDQPSQPAPRSPSRSTRATGSPRRSANSQGWRQSI
jgi:hypothetical protein